MTTSHIPRHRLRVFDSAAQRRGRGPTRLRLLVYTIKPLKRQRSRWAMSHLNKPCAPPCPHKEPLSLPDRRSLQGEPRSFPQSGRSSAANKGRFPQNSRAGALAQRTASVAIMLEWLFTIPEFSYKRPGCAGGRLFACFTVRYRIASSLARPLRFPLSLRVRLNKPSHTYIYT